MDKHKPSDEMIKDLDNLLSKLNGMEIVASDDYQKNSIKVMELIFALFASSKDKKIIYLPLKKKYHNTNINFA